jgi:UDP-N-acetyl-D-mannosaminuronate dehydrogenase
MPLAYCPIRGKKAKMLQDLQFYTKFVADINDRISNKALIHFETAGLKAKKFSSIESLELAKLLSTTYFGLLIAWAQETERFCNKLNFNYDVVMSFTEEIDYSPPVIFKPG